MKCPVCKDVTLLMSEKKGVEIDYCPECRGIWLDRGELEKIMENLRHEENVLGCVLSGAGPSILIISQKNNLDKIHSIVKDTWADLNVKAIIKTLQIEQNGAQVVNNED